MQLVIRKETPEDFKEVHEVVKKAFKDQQYSDQKEHFLVDKLRKSASFIPELSLVAEYEHLIVGYILLTEIKIVTAKNEIVSLTLAPVAVLPDYQNKGIGGTLIKTAHKAAKALGYGSVVVLGHESYYPKFGYKKALDYSINLPFDVPPENSMVIELIPGSLQDNMGDVVYPNEFY